MRLVRFDNPPAPSSMAAMKTVPSSPPVICTLRTKAVLSCTGVDQVTPSSECVTKGIPPTPKSFHETYIRPSKGLAGLLSTHIDSRSSSAPECAHAPTLQVRPSADVHKPIPWPPHPVARSPANHLCNRALNTRIGSPKFVPWPLANGAGSRRVNVAPPSVDLDTPE